MLTGCSWGRSRDAHGVTPTGFQNGSKMGAKSGPRETMKTVLPSGRELRGAPVRAGAHFSLQAGIILRTLLRSPFLGSHWTLTGCSLGTHWALTGRSLAPHWILTGSHWGPLDGSTVFIVSLGQLLAPIWCDFGRKGFPRECPVNVP